MKTYTSRQLTLYISILLTSLALIFLLFTWLLSPGFWVLLILVIVFFLTSYFYVTFVINKYISDKIRPVYKTIKDLPLSGKNLKKSHPIPQICCQTSGMKLKNGQRRK